MEALIMNKILEVELFTIVYKVMYGYSPTTEPNLSLQQAPLQLLPGHFW